MATRTFSRTGSSLAALALLGACGAVLRPPEPDRRLDVRSSGAVFESDRGYTFAVAPEPGAKVIRLDVTYPVGSADDPPGKEGLAHLVEHLLIEVEVARDGAKTSIAAATGKIALDFNAQTTTDSTTYQVVAAPEALDALFALEIDRLTVGCAGITREEVARSREIVINELRTHDGGSGAELRRLVHESLYPERHPYRAVDTIASVSKLQLEDVCGFLVGPYRRGKVIVVASGAIDAPTLQAVAARHLGRAPRRTAASSVVPPPVAPRPGILRLRADVDEPMLLVSWPLPPIESREYRLLQMAWRYAASRLEKFAFVYGWGNTAWTGVLGGGYAPMLVLGVNLRKVSDADEAISAAQKAMEHAFRVVYAPGDNRESPRWLAQWESRVESLLATWESLEGRNDMLASHLRFGGALGGVLIAQITELHQAQPREVQTLAEKWLSPEIARHLVIEPSGTASVAGASLYRGHAEAHRVPVDGALADRPLPMPASALGIDVERYTLGNGLSVVLWPDGNAPVVYGRLIVHAGSVDEPRGLDGLSGLVGASDALTDHLVFERRELSTRVDDLIGGLAAELRAPGYGFSDEDKAYLKGRLVQQRARERAGFHRDLMRALYGAEHPYARGTMTEGTLAPITHDTVQDWARRYVVPRNATLVIAGKFDPALVKKHIRYHAEHVSGGDVAADRRGRELIDPPAPSARVVRGVTAKPSPTVDLGLYFVGGAGIDRDHGKRLVLEQVLALQLSRLRESQALTYSFSASFYPRRAGGLWLLSGDVDAARAAEASRSLRAILDQMRRDPETYRADFVLARQKVLQALLSSATSSEAITSRLSRLARFDLPDYFFDQLARNIASETLPGFHNFLNSELPATRQVLGAFGNSAPVDAATNVQP